jgi:hypothetical protein
VVDLAGLVMQFMGVGAVSSIRDFKPVEAKITEAAKAIQNAIYDRKWTQDRKQ